jgi:aerobic-type carbon monoxide dehydrogenase small subunit (CoxS/CutS family)
MAKKISFTLNGKKTEFEADPKETLLWVLRNRLGLTGTKFGCGQGYCGSCTVLIDNEAVRSCTLPVSDVEGKQVLTIEGLAPDGKLSPLQQAFVDHDALQCGYCTPGMIMNATALLKKNPKPARQEIIEGMEDNLCRCGAHKRIIEAIESVASTKKGGK